MVKKSKYGLVILITLPCLTSLCGQSDTTSVYHVRPWRSALVGVTGIALHQFGLAKQRQAPEVAAST